MKTKVLNFSNIFPHYCLSMWRSFIRHMPNFFIGFQSYDTRGIELVDVKKEFSEAEQKRFFEIKNIYLLNKHLVYQFFVIPKVIFSSYEKAIFLGDSKVISTWISLIICKLRKKESILWTHGIYGNESKLKLLIRRIFYKLADTLIVYERKGKNGLIRYGFSKDKIHVIFNSLNFNFQKQILQKLKEEKSPINFFSNNELPYLITVGRLTERKKISLLLDALSKINIKKKKCNLLIIGDGDDMKNLQNKAKEYKGVVHFYGPCYDEKRLGQLLYHASVCVIPGDIGLSAIHSLTYGTPVITHNKFSTQGPEHEAIEVGISGDFYSFGEVDDLYSKIIFWLEKEREKKKYISICRKNIDRYYNPDYQVKVMKNIIEGGNPLI